MAYSGQPGMNPVPKRLWFALTAPGGAWFVHLVATYVLVPWSCMMGGRWAMVGGSALLAGVTVAAGWVSWSLWRRLDESERAQVMTMEGSRTGFMVFGGLLASGLFLLGIILGTIPLFFIDPCLPGPTH